MSSQISYGGRRRRRNILIINPNSTTSMTDSLANMTGLSSAKSNYNYFTNPDSPASINNAADGELSLQNCMPGLSRSGYLDDFNGYLVACYSDHPLVPWLKSQPSVQRAKKPVTGIFEASVWKSLRVIKQGSQGQQMKFGIVSTGKVWEGLLTKAVRRYFEEELQQEEQVENLFAGVETTGLNATDLHDAPEGEVSARMKDATKRLLRNGNVAAIALGCAGMSGLDTIVREALKEELGEEDGSRIAIIDGVKAGVEWLEEIL